MEIKYDESSQCTVCGYKSEEQGSHQTGAVTTGRTPSTTDESEQTEPAKKGFPWWIFIIIAAALIAAAIAAVFIVRKKGKTDKDRKE
ncbi:MAG: hypothetical protein II777_06265 [Clostridia bacterium]|nr:hypothetical protein [Clostridia bacterium]